MAYIRVKKIRTKKGSVYEYAYLVENRYRKRKKGARQKVLDYLGKVYQFDVDKRLVFEVPEEVDAAAFVEEFGYRGVVRKLVGFELLRHGFAFSDGAYSQAGIIVTVDEKSISFGNGNEMRSDRSATEKSGNDKIVLAFNEGFLCKKTYLDLLTFRAESDDEHDVGKAFGHAVLEAGIGIPKNVFVALFQKVSGLEIDH